MLPNEQGQGPNPNLIITMEMPATSRPDIVLVPLPAWERAADPEIGLNDVKVMRRNGSVTIQARFWQWELYAFVVNALKENADVTLDNGPNLQEPGSLQETGKQATG